MMHFRSAASQKKFEKEAPIFLTFATRDTMSSFFTLPASQKKRKRPETAGSKPTRRQQSAPSRPTKKRREVRDESISGSESDVDADDAESSQTLVEESSEDESDEDAAGRRTRLAERYLENTRREILAEGFDAKDIDNELLAQRMGERLKEDTAESKGKIYRWIADEYNWPKARHAPLKSGLKGTPTGIAVCFPFVYSVSSDMELVKWEMTRPAQTDATDGTSAAGRRLPKPKVLAMTYGKRNRHKDTKYEHHTRPILCVAASEDGKFVVTGGQDKKLIVWDATTLKALKVFTMHRDAVTSVCFRRGTNQLFSASKDRTIKIWSMDELAYVETLYGHQDEVLDVGALNQEKCITAGARDRTARLWRVVEESQLVFRGGGSGTAGFKRRKGDDEEGADKTTASKGYNEGSIDRVAVVDEETFITGSDNGSLSLWNIQKKKAVFTYPLAHGLQPPQKPDEASAEANPSAEAVAEPQPRWITALACLPFSNIIVSGSWDGQLRAWKISEDKRRLEALGPIGETVSDKGGLENGTPAEVDGVSSLPNGIHDDEAPVFQGVINDVAVFEKGEKGRSDIGIAAVMGREHRLGRWLKVEGKNSGIVFDLPRV